VPRIGSLRINRRTGRYQMAEQCVSPLRSLCSAKVPSAHALGK